eukprot:g76369.t1
MYQKLGEVNADKGMSCPTQQPLVVDGPRDGPRLTESPSPGYSRQLGALLPTYLLAASVLVKDSEARLPVLLFLLYLYDYMSRACLASVLFSANSAFLCVFLTFIPRKNLGNLGSLLSNNTSFESLQHNALLLC